MQQQIIQPKVLIVEDNDKIANALRRRLDIVFKTDRYCLIPDFELVATFESFQMLLIEQVSLNQPTYYSVILDINLGEDHKEEGLDILRYIKKHCSDMMHPIIYSAYPNKRQECMGAGLNSDSFFIKNDGGLMGDIQNIKLRIEREFVETCNNSVLFSGLDLFIGNNRVKRRYSYMSITFNAEDFILYNEPEKLLLFYFFTTKVESGLNVFSSKKRLWRFSVTDRFISNTVSYFLIQKINADTGLVEGIQLQLEGKTIHLNLPDIETIEKGYETLLGYIQKENNVENHFVEFFLVQRLINLYSTGTKEERQRIVELAKSIHYKVNRMLFLFGLWERMAKMDIDADESAWVENSEYVFSEMFYGEIEDIDEAQSPPVASVRLQSVEDLEVFFYRNFDLQMLGKYGLMHINDRFKYILFSEKEPFRESFTIIPVPPNISF